VGAMLHQQIEPEDQDSASVEAVRAPAHRRADLARFVRAWASVPILAGAASAYGFLEGHGSHPAAKLGGALLLAGLGVIFLFLGRSTLLRGHGSGGTNTTALRRQRRDILKIGLALLSVAAALIHFAVIEQHFMEYWLYGAFFVAVGLFELAWAALVVAGSNRLLYWAGVLVNALNVAAYVITRTVGLLVGPSAAETERLGFGDLMSTVFEALLVVGSALLLARSLGRGRVRQGTAEAWIAALAVMVTATTTLALLSTVGGPPFISPAG
jgi:hypothetical protein